MFYLNTQNSSQFIKLDTINFGLLYFGRAIDMVIVLLFLLSVFCTKHPLKNGGKKTDSVTVTKWVNAAFFWTCGWRP